MNSGKHQIQKFTIGQDDYFVVLNKNDDDPGFTTFTVYVTKGPWQVSSPEIIASRSFNTADETWQTDPIAYFHAGLLNLNAQIVSIFTPTPEPDPWANTIVNQCLSLILNPQGGLHLQERNWGGNPDLNKWLAIRTGYPGDFGAGLFNAWAVSHGFVVQDLIDEYNASH